MQGQWTILTRKKISKMKFNRIKPAWEQLGVSFEEYVVAFNKMQEEMFERQLKSELYFGTLISDKPRRSCVITNFCD